MSGSSSTIVCPKCKANVNLRGRAMTVALVCPSCHNYYCVGDWNNKTYSFTASPVQHIPIGAKGRFDNFLYEVIGFVVKEELKWHYQWKEYLLFNPYRGYAFLSESGGHWNFIWPIEDEPKRISAEEYLLDNREFKIYQRYAAKVIYARGEFFFDVIGITSSTTNVDFIAPPYLLTVEESDDSILWCKGEYFSRKEIAAIFSIRPDQLPVNEGVGYTQPFVGAFSKESLIKSTILAVILLVILQLALNNTAEEKVVYHGTYSSDQLKEDKMFVTPSFDLSEGLGNVEFYIEAPLSNDWFYGEFTLINETDGTEYNFSKDIEFYYGYEGGENWSEGSKVGTAVISRIPGGKYHVNIYPEFSTYNKAFSVIITRDVASSSNFWYAGIAILLYPVFYFIRHYYREKRRWSDSEFSPYEE